MMRLNAPVFAITPPRPNDKKGLLNAKVSATRNDMSHPGAKCVADQFEKRYPQYDVDNDGVEETEHCQHHHAHEELCGITVQFEVGGLGVEDGAHQLALFCTKACRMMEDNEWISIFGSHLSIISRPALTNGLYSTQGPIRIKKLVR